VGGVDGVDEEFRVRVRHAHPEDAEPERIVGRHPGLVGEDCSTILLAFISRVLSRGRLPAV